MEAGGYPLPVVRMNAFDPPGGRLGVRDDILPAEYFAPCRVPGLCISGHIPIPDHVIGRLQRQSQAFLAGFHGLRGRQPQSHLAPLQEAIDRVFSKPSLPGILEALAKEEGGWAADARQQVARNSPFSLAVCHRQLTTAEGLSFEDCMRREFAMSLRFGKEADFREGMRAQIVDKDRNPTWRHASISKIDQAEIDAIFAPLTTVPGLALGQ